jgi:serine protease Do
LSNSVTTGVVSALHRSIDVGNRQYEDFVQTDAAINPGNSGGALLDIEGRLIGINTAIFQSANGIGFAIPIDRAMAVVEEVLAYGEVRPVFLGISVDSRASGGARVRLIHPGTPAETSGLAPGDVIIDINGSAIERGRDFLEHERGLVSGQEVRLRARRGKNLLDVVIVAKEQNRKQAVALGREALGLDVRPAGQRGLLRISKVARGGHAAELGIRAGDYLVSLGGRRIETVEDFENICAQLRGAEAVAAIVARGRRQYYVTLRLAAPGSQL